MDKHPLGMTVPGSNALIATAVICLATLTGCGVLDPGGSEILQSVTRLTRDTQGTSPAALAYSAPASARVCPAGNVCLTPDNLEGRVYAASLMVGGNGPAGAVGYAVTTVGENAEVRRRPDLGKDGAIAFNLNSTTDISGDYTCCGGTPYPPDSLALIRRLEFAFDYVDATFTVPGNAGAAIAGSTYTIRLVYVTETAVDDVAGDAAPILLGDKLVRGPGDDTFRWCTATDCLADTRPADPLADTGIVLNTDLGNQNYAVFAINLEDDRTISFTEAEAMQGNWMFEVRFLLGDALSFIATDWSDITTVQELVEAFTFRADVGESSVEVQLSKAPV